MRRPIFTTSSSCFLGQEFIKRLINKSDCNHQGMLGQLLSKLTSQTHLYISCPPESHKFQTQSLLVIRQGSRPSEGTAYNCIHSVMAVSQVANPKIYCFCPQQQAIHHFLHQICKQQATIEVVGLDLLNITVYKNTWLFKQTSIHPKLVHEPYKGKVRSIARPRTG
jgi:hypothetical protein